MVRRAGKEVFTGRGSARGPVGPLVPGPLGALFADAGSFACSPWPHDIEIPSMPADAVLEKQDLCVPSQDQPQAYTARDLDTIAEVTTLNRPCSAGGTDCIRRPASASTTQQRPSTVSNAHKQNTSAQLSVKLRAKGNAAKCGATADSRVKAPTDSRVKAPAQRTFIRRQVPAKTSSECTVSVAMSVVGKSDIPHPHLNPQPHPHAQPASWEAKVNEATDGGDPLYLSPSPIAVSSAPVTPKSKFSRRITTGLNAGEIQHPVVYWNGPAQPFSNVIPGNCSDQSGGHFIPHLTNAGPTVPTGVLMPATPMASRLENAVLAPANVLMPAPTGSCFGSGMLATSLPTSKQSMESQLGVRRGRVNGSQPQTPPASRIPTSPPIYTPSPALETVQPDWSSEKTPRPPLPPAPELTCRVSENETQCDFTKSCFHENVGDMDPFEMPIAFIEEIPTVAAMLRDSEAFFFTGYGSLRLDVASELGQYPGVSELFGPDTPKGSCASDRTQTNFRMRHRNPTPARSSCSASGGSSKDLEALNGWADDSSSIAHCRYDNIIRQEHLDYCARGYKEAPPLPPGPIPAEVSVKRKRSASRGSCQRLSPAASN